MQYNLSAARLFTLDTLPASKPSNFYSKRDVLIIDDGTQFIWDNGWKQVNIPSWGGSTGTGTDGKDATVKVGTVTTTTLPAGQPASVQVTDADPSTSDATLNFAFAIPQGQQGEPGTGSGGTWTELPGGSL